MESIESYALSIFEKMPAGIPVVAFLAGGCFRSFYDGTLVKDYDLFFASEQDWRMACQFFRSSPDFVELTKPSEESYPSFQRGSEPPFNLIGFRYHKTVADLAASFDFTCCAIAAELIEDGAVEVYHQPLAAEHASARLLAFQNHQHIDRVTKRRNRYVEQYGYTESPGFSAGLAICRTVPRSTASGDY